MSLVSFAQKTTPAAELLQENTLEKETLADVWAKHRSKLRDFVAHGRHKGKEPAFDGS